MIRKYDLKQFVSKNQRIQRELLPPNYDVGTSAEHCNISKYPSTNYY